MKPDKIREIFVGATLDQVTEFTNAWNQYAGDFGITSKKHEDMLLTTIYHEVGADLLSKRENLNYTPEALRKTFSRYKNYPQWSYRDGRTKSKSADQVSIGNVAYADRLGNGDIASGDGYKFRGGGYIQTTGRANWHQAAKTISMLTSQAINAEYLARNVAKVEIGLLMAFAFFFDNNMSNCDDMDDCTDKVNKHTSSRQARNKTYDKIENIA